MITTADVIERYLENHVNVRKDELVLAVDNHFGEGWFRHNYINRTIDDMVKEGIIECWNTRYCLPVKEEANVITTLAQHIRKCVLNSPGCYKHQIMVSVRTTFGRYTYSAEYVVNAIALEVEKDNIFCQQGRYYAHLSTLEHEELLSLACNDETPKEVKKVAFEEIIGRMSRKG